MPAARRLKLLFASYHSYLDPSSGSTISLRDLFQLLKARGHECQAFSGPQLDYEQPKTLAELLKYLNLPHQTRSGTAAGLDFTLYNVLLDGVPAALYETPAAAPARNLTDQQGLAHLALFERVLDQFKPDVVLTYGGQKMAAAAMELAKARGARVVFWLRNCSYTSRDFFRHTDGALVPSSFSTDFYRRTIGLPTTAIPSPLDWKRVECELVERKYLTFVNPSPVKGVYVFARVAEVLARRRPDIPLLVVESRGKADWLQKTGIDLAKMGNLTGMTNTRDPRKFLGLTRAMFAPSVWPETFGRVTAEAMINGIPVLASDRGGLPEVVGRGGFVFRIPDRFTPESKELPTEADVEPMVGVVARLWDDEAFYIRACLNARVEAEKWRPQRLADQYEQYFLNLVGDRPAAAPPATPEPAAAAAPVPAAKVVPLEAVEPAVEPAVESAATAAETA